jgi:NAD-dependent deacetylase
MEKENESKISQLNLAVRKAKHIVFFGGAGVSTESGIPDFRSAQGIFTNNLSAEEIVSNDCFFNDTKTFYDFYKSKMMYLDAKPNKCHEKLAELEKEGKDITIVTQNIDGLHQLAGSKKVLELHGSIHSNHCLECGKSFDAAYVKNSEGLPLCDHCGGLIKPDVVLYGEQLNYDTITAAIEAIEEADLLIVGGTSLKVYPAASFIGYFKGQNKFYINLDADVEIPGYIHIQEKIGDVFSRISLKD